MSRRIDLANNWGRASVTSDIVLLAADAQRIPMGSRSLVACRGVATLMLTVFLGCSGSDLSGYRPLDKAGGSKNGETLLATVPPLNSDENNETAKAVRENGLATPASDGELPPASALAPINVVDGANVGALLKVVPGEAISVVAPSTIGSPTTPPSTAAQPHRVEVLIPDKTFRTDAASKALRVSYDDLDLLKVINMEPVTTDAVDHMPAWLKGLNGQRIKIRGFMYPTFETEGIERFVLARDNQICCFGRDPKIYDLVQIDLRGGKTTHYIPATRAFDVVGRLKIEMVAEGGQPFGLYFLEDAEVIDR
jgi:hypothetical protein